MEHNEKLFEFKQAQNSIIHKLRGDIQSVLNQLSTLESTMFAVEATKDAWELQSRVENLISYMENTHFHTYQYITPIKNLQMIIPFEATQEERDS